MTRSSRLWPIYEKIGRVMPAVRLRRPADGDYAHWDSVEIMAIRYPLALSEMRWPSKPLHTMEAQPLARWGIDIMIGWRVVTDQHPTVGSGDRRATSGRRDQFRILQIKEKFGHMTIYLASEPTPEMRKAIGDAWQKSSMTCEVCGERGILAERRCYWSVRCGSHENWQFWGRPLA